MKDAIVSTTFRVFGVLAIVLGILIVLLGSLHAVVSFVKFALEITNIDATRLSFSGIPGYVASVLAYLLFMMVSPGSGVGAIICVCGVIGFKQVTSISKGPRPERMVTWEIVRDCSIITVLRIVSISVIVFGAYFAILWPLTLFSHTADERIDESILAIALIAAGMLASWIGKLLLDKS